MSDQELRVSQWVVECVKQSDGRAFQATVWAFDESDALRRVSGDGVLAHKAHRTVQGLAEADIEPIRESIRRSEAIQQDLMMEVRRLRNSRLIARPFSTIGWGVVYGIVMWTLILIGLWLLFFGIAMVFGLAIGGLGGLGGGGGRGRPF